MKFNDFIKNENMDGFVDEFKYFVSFIDEKTNEIIHICGYEVNPKVRDINHLFEELKTDKDFGMSEDYLNSLKVRIFKKKDI